MKFYVNTIKIWLNRSFHISRLIAWLSVGVLLGVALIAITPDNFVFSNLWLFISIILFIAVLRKPTRLSILPIVIAGIVIGLVRGGGVETSLNRYEELLGKTVEVYGIIAEDPAFVAPDKQRLSLRSIEIGGVKMSGKVWVTISSQIELKRTDRAHLSGVLGKGFGTINATLNNTKIIDVKRPLHGDVARDLRDWFARGVHKNIVEPEASLALGFLVGQRSTLPESLESNLRILGLTHIIVASGYNLTILVRLARRKLMKISRYSALIGSFALVTLFILITGFSPSMSRAGIVVVLSLLAWYYGRKIQPFVLLSVSAAVTVLLNPSYIWGDIGWYLSFLSFFGVIVMAPLLRTYFFADKTKPHFLRDVLIETSSAQIMTLPLIAFVFGQYSPLSLIANILILPTIPFAMLATFISGIISLILSPLGMIASLPAQLILGYITHTVNWFAKIPWASGSITINVGHLIVLYILIAGATTYLHIKTRKSLQPFDFI